MSDTGDLESSLAEMDRKLRELQRELALLSRPPGHEPEPLPRPPEPDPEPLPASPLPHPPTPSASTSGGIEHAAARVAELGRRIDALADLRKELDLAASTLREEQRRGTSRQASQ